MNYLLDTHAFLWLLFDQSKLSKKVQKILTQEEGEIFVSATSFWEISLKHGLGKIRLENVLPEDLPDIAQYSGLSLLNITPKDAASMHQLPKEKHKDPFDRMIVWQCLKNQLALISKDKDLQNYTALGLQTIW